MSICKAITAFGFKNVMRHPFLSARAVREPMANRGNLFHLARRIKISDKRLSGLNIGNSVELKLNIAKVLTLFSDVIEYPDAGKILATDFVLDKCEEPLTYGTKAKLSVDGVDKGSLFEVTFNVDVYYIHSFKVGNSTVSLESPLRLEIPLR